MATLVNVNGDHFSMGVQQGEDLKDTYDIFIDELFKSPLITKIKPRFVPNFIVKFFFGLYGRLKIKKTLKTHVPNQFERIQGMAKGFKASLNFLYALHFSETLSGSTKVTMDFPDASCTQIFALPQATVDEIGYLGRNYDYPNELREYQIVRQEEPAEGLLKNISVTQTFLSGSHQGLNEKGLAIAFNYGRVWKEGDFDLSGVPSTLIVQEVLENISTTEEAVEFITKFPRRGNAGFYGLLDKNNNACVVETTASTFSVRYPEEGVMAQTNLFTNLVDHNLPDHIVWNLPNMKRPYTQSPRERYKRANELVIKTNGDISLETIKSILRDHNNTTPSDDTICTHGEVGSTLASIIIAPKTNLFLVTDQFPCQATYEKFKLNW